MAETAIIFGAGKTGRGFAAHLAFLGGYDVVLVDKNMELIDALNKECQYYIQVLGDEGKNETIKFTAALHIDDAAWHEKFSKAHVAFTAVFGNNLEDLSISLATALQKRADENKEQPLTIITCENLTNAAQFLKDCALKNLPSKSKAWLSKNVGFSEAIIFKTCLGASATQSPLTIRAQNFFELPCDGHAIKAPLHVFGLKPLQNFDNQLKRKIFTYNCINAVTTYVGAKKGYTQLYDAGNDEEVLKIARKAAEETSAALIAAYGFDAREQSEWTKAAFAKFSDRNIPDPIERNGADPLRKLSREDRLIGPALLALKHGIHPEALLDGIIACFEYEDNGFKVSDLINEKGLDAVLKKVCGLSTDEQLFMLIKEKYRNNAANEN